MRQFATRQFNTILKIFGRMNEPNLHSPNPLERLCELRKGDIAVAALTDTECSLAIQLEVESSETFDVRVVDGSQTGPNSFQIWCGYDQPRTEAEAWKTVGSGRRDEPGTGGLILNRLILHFDPLPQKDIQVRYTVWNTMSSDVIQEGTLMWSPEDEHQFRG